MEPPASLQSHAPMGVGRQVSHGRRSLWATGLGSCSFLMLSANQQDTLQVCCEETFLETCCLEGTSHLQLLGSALSIPSLRLSRVQDKALSGCLLQNTWRCQRALMACQPVQAPSHTVIHTALRRLCQQAWPNWAQLLCLHLQRV